jgi:hypothetical protein
MSLPVVGSVDWKWFLIGILFGKFVLGYLLGLVSHARGAVAGGSAG